MFLKYLKGNTVLILLAAITVVSTVTTAVLVDRALKENLVTRANTIASLLSALPNSTLQGNEQDLTNPQYLILKKKLTELHEINKDSRFLYVVKLVDGDVLFLVDSEPSDSEDYSPPGQIYEEVTNHFRTATIQGLSGWEMSLDRWGAWMTGYAPIYNEQTGQLLGLVGIDLDLYRNYLYPVAGYSVIPLSVFLIIITIIYYWRKLEVIEKEIAKEKDQLIRIAHHEFGTPVAEYDWACQQLMESKIIRDNKKVLALARQMYVSLQTLIRRTANLLKTIELTASEPLRLSTIDVVQIIQESIQTHKKLAEVNAKKIIIKQPFPAKALIKGNVSSLQIVFANLILHSLFYTQKDDAVQISYKNYDTYHEFMFLSSGDTLKENEKSNLFSAYYKGETLSSHTQSTGLGLYLIRKIVTLHNGKVAAMSDSHGVSLCVLLPGT